MNELEFLEKWSAALRSGQFQQARGILVEQDNSKHCCLGVACVVLNIPLNHEPYYHLSPHIPQASLGGFGQNNFIDMNDNKKLDFNQIADFIDLEIERRKKNSSSQKTENPEGSG